MSIFICHGSLRLLGSPEHRIPVRSQTHGNVPTADHQISEDIINDRERKNAEADAL